MPVAALAHCSEEMLLYLHHILVSFPDDPFPVSFPDDPFPALLQTAVKMIHKAGPTNVIRNFRPISLTTSLYRILTKHLRNVLNEQLQYSRADTSPSTGWI